MYYTTRNVTNLCHQLPRIHRKECNSIRPSSRYDTIIHYAPLILRDLKTGGSIDDLMCSQLKCNLYQYYTPKWWKLLKKITIVLHFKVGTWMYVAYTSQTKHQQWTTEREREPAFTETSKHHFIAGVLQRHGLTKANENMVRQYFVRKCVMREQLARSISCDKRRIWSAVGK